MTLDTSTESTSAPPSDSRGARVRSREWAERISRTVPSIGLVVLLALLWAAAALFVPEFANGSNLMNILRQSADLVIAALGVMFVLLIGGIDLSIGSVFGFSSVVLATLVFGGTPVPLAILIVLAVAAVAGAVSGALTHFGRIPAFITTLGMYYILFAFAQMISNGLALKLPPGTMLQGLSRGTVFGIPNVVLVATGAAIVAWVVLNRTPYGRDVVSVGLNRQASRFSGLPVSRVAVGVFMISAVLAAVSAILLTARVQSGEPALGGLTGTFEVITAAVVGGTSLFGGRGTVLGVVVGAIIIRTIGNCITLLDISSLLYQAVMGVLILIALIVEAVRLRQKGGVE